MTSFEIVGFVVSPRRRFDGRPADGPSPYEGDEHPAAVRVRAGKGVVGDRYFGTRFTYAAMTFVAQESIERLEGELGTGPFDPLLARRNVVTRGLDVDALVRTSFVLEQDGAPLAFRSITPANPCAWMDEMFAPGAHRALRGHAGIRCEPLDDGALRLGPATLVTSSALADDELRRRVSTAPVGTQH